MARDLLKTFYHLVRVVSVWDYSCYGGAGLDSIVVAVLGSQMIDGQLRSGASAAGGIVSIIYSLWRTEWELVIPEHVVNGILGALVSITPSCACTHSYDAFPIGMIGSLVALGANSLICKLRLDDPVGAVGVHAGGKPIGIFLFCY